jgi:predicted DNA-binding transcriptional regulator AlpA
MTNANNAIESLLTEQEVAKLLKVSVATIRRRRLFRQPPGYLKIGASVRYRREAVQRLIESAEQRAETR